MKELITFVESWAFQRKLDTADPSRQMLKVIEEVGELAAGLARENMDLIKDAIGDVLVTIIVLSMQLRVSPQECLNLAWQEIKDRQGTLKNGVFIKEEQE